MVSAFSVDKHGIVIPSLNNYTMLLRMSSNKPIILSSYTAMSYRDSGEHFGKNRTNIQRRKENYGYRG